MLNYLNPLRYILRPKPALQEDIIELIRGITEDDYTHGALIIDGEPFCYTLEPTKLRIPSGDYQLKFNTTGGMNKRYKDLFKFHQGMIELINVKNRTHIYMHIGNKMEDSLGCILVGFDRYQSTIGHSRDAYIALYNRLTDKILKGCIVRVI